jgi:5-methylcytosine-specific restriction endonuclease McrA
MTYSEKLKDPRWQKKRLKIMEYANWRCQICGNKDNTLHCHHSYYTRGKQPWQYPDGSIICICQECHEKIHKKPEPPRPPDPAPVVRRAEPPVDIKVAATGFAALREMLERVEG